VVFLLDTEGLQVESVQMNVYGYNVNYYSNKKSIMLLVTRYNVMYNIGNSLC
jgi:hypothetical protein